VVDVERKYGNWFDALNARVVLIRPDFHVFGTSSGDIDSTSLLVADFLHEVTGSADHQRTSQSIRETADSKKPAAQR